MQKILSLIAIALFVAGCGGGDSSQTPVARIGNRTLTSDEVKAALRSDVEPTPGQTRQFVQRWIADELIYREAVNQGLDQSEAITAQLEELRRQLAINALLEKEVYSSTAADVPADSVKRFYETHLPEFVLKQDVALVSYVLFGDRDAATAFRNSVVKGAPWDSAVTAAGAILRGRVDSAYHTQQSLQPPELWRVAWGLNGNDPSFPINTADGYYVLKIWKTQKQGQTADLVSVEREIRHRLAVEQRRLRYDAFIASLRSRHTIEVYLREQEADSTTSRTLD